MKKAILTFLSICIAITAFSQTVNDVPIKDIDVEYIQLVSGIGPILSAKTNVNIDFGQATSLLSKKNAVIKDKDGKRIKFNSMIDALNFMSKNGYEFVQAYVMVEGDNSYCHYLMRKKKNEPTSPEKSAIKADKVS